MSLKINKGAIYSAAYDANQSYAKVAKEFDLDESTVRQAIKRFKSHQPAVGKLESVGYSIAPEYAEPTPKEAWDAHKGVFERKVAMMMARRWPVAAHKTGPYALFHSTDEHLDDDSTPLALIEADIKAAHDLGSIMCHGGDLLNNWPLAGRLAAQWAEQKCSRPEALFRAQHFISLFKPDVWTDGNHEEFNPYLADMIKGWLPSTILRSEWTQSFLVTAKGGRTLRAVMSHKFQKGSSWFHKAHGHIREMLEGEEADLLMDGHLHSDGVLDHTLPERGHAALCVASSGYKVVDKFAGRISRGGTLPKLRGRAHWMIVDPYAEMDENFVMAFKSPIQAEVYLNGLQNLRAV